MPVNERSDTKQNLGLAIYTVFKGKMMQYCVAVLLVACVAAIPKSHPYGLHRPVHQQVLGGGNIFRNPFVGPAGGLQNSVLFNGINGGRRLSGSGGHITKSLTHHGKSIHVNDGRNVATATAHHDGRVSANVVPSHLVGPNRFAAGPAVVGPGVFGPQGGVFGPVRGPVSHISPYVGPRRGKKY